MKGTSKLAGKDSPIFNGKFVISGRKPKKLVKTEEKKKNGEQSKPFYVVKPNWTDGLLI